MTLVDAAPLVQVKEIARPAFVYNQAMDLIARLGAKGLVSSAVHIVHGIQQVLHEMLVLSH